MSLRGEHRLFDTVMSLTGNGVYLRTVACLGIIPKQAWISSPVFHPLWLSNQFIKIKSKLNTTCYPVGFWNQDVFFLLKKIIKIGSSLPGDNHNSLIIIVADGKWWMRMNVMECPKLTPWRGHNQRNLFQLWLQHHLGSRFSLWPVTRSQLWLQPHSEGSAASSAWALISTMTGSGPCSGHYFDWPHFHCCFSSSHCLGQDFSSSWAETSAISLSGSEFGSGPILGHDFDSGSCSGCKFSFGLILSCCFCSVPSWSVTSSCLFQANTWVPAQHWSQVWLWLCITPWADLQSLLLGSFSSTPTWYQAVTSALAPGWAVILVLVPSQAVTAGLTSVPAVRRDQEPSWASGMSPAPSLAMIAAPGPISEPQLWF